MEGREDCRENEREEHVKGKKSEEHGTTIEHNRNITMVSLRIYTKLPGCS